MTYEQSLKDWKYLFEDIAPAGDMTGGYVDQEDLDKLLKSPTKRTAKDCLESQIGYWFQHGPDLGDGGYTECQVTLQRLISEDDRVREIGDSRYLI